MKFYTEVSPLLATTGRKFHRQTERMWLAGSFVAGVTIDRVTRYLDSDAVISESHYQDIYMFQPKQGGGYTISSYVPSLEDKNADDWAEYFPVAVSVTDVVPDIPS
jgi:hypothetical protein